MTNAANSLFKKGTGVYLCRICGKRTRDAGDDSAGVLLCSHCYDKCVEENAAADSYQGTEGGAS